MIGIRLTINNWNRRRANSGERRQNQGRSSRKQCQLDEWRRRNSGREERENGRIRRMATTL